MYIDLLEKAGITPNFYISKEYFRKAKFVEIMDKRLGLCYVKDEDWVVFPAVGLNGYDLKFFGDKVWSDFSFSLKGVVGYKPTFLDYEYIYDSKRFLTMEGGDWAVFRKNCRKFPNRHGEGTYVKISNFDKNILNNLLIEWLKGMEGKEILDDEVMLNYLQDGENRKILYLDGEIVGINIWDENYKYINFRYSFCKKEDFLPEYMRILFYKDKEILNENKLINDGGICNSENLKRFKDKMNPIFVREVCSWIKK